MTVRVPLSKDDLLSAVLELLRKQWELPEGCTVEIEASDNGQSVATAKW